MAVRARRLFGPIIATAADGNVLLYEVPAGRTAIFRGITVLNPLTVTAAVVLSVQVPGGNLVGVFARGALTTNETQPYPADLILNPGDKLWGTTFGSGATSHWLGVGTLLFGAPE